MYEVVDLKGLPNRVELASLLKTAYRHVAEDAYQMDPGVHRFDAFVDVINKIGALRTAPRAALKELLPDDAAVNPTTALARMKRELDALRAVDHPALIKVLDSDLDHRWFVMECFDHTLKAQPDRFKGRPLDALRAIRPLVEAVARLHTAGIVHRDIKWDNVFLGTDGGLVLGDCGLAFPMKDAIDRVTDTLEKVGTTAWMPVWAYRQRLDEVRPNFDVFGLGKLLWCMVTGEPPFPVWQFDKAEYDLRRRFPNDPASRFLHRLLKESVTEEPEDCLPDAGVLLTRIDATIRALAANGQLPGSQPMRCTICASANYTGPINFRNEGLFSEWSQIAHYRCGSCGHVVSFLFGRGESLPAWSD